MYYLKTNLKLKIMKKGLFTLAILFVAFIGFNNLAKAQEVSNGPQITVDKEVHDYGTIDQGANGTCTFTVTNTGNAPLIISLCKGSCGCTVPTCPTEPIAPGATASITVKYDTNRVGAINKTLTITSNDVVSPTTLVRLKGNVLAKETVKTETKTAVKQ
jgi:hypothetical protein